MTNAILKKLDRKIQNQKFVKLLEKLLKIWHAYVL